MSKKFFAVIALLTAFAITGFAGDIVRFDFNCYGSDADIVPVGKLPDGVTIRKKAPFNNKKIVGRATPLIIDLGKVRKIDLEFTFHGKTGTIVPSLIPWRRKNGKMPVLECTKLELNGKTSPKAPLKFSDWVNMGIKIEANDGDTITLKMEFAPPAAAAPQFPGIRSTDRAAVEAAAKRGPTPYHRVMSRLRLVQIDAPETVDTYAKQAAVIDRILAEEGAKDPALKFCVPLCTPQGKEIWPPEGWHAAHDAGHFREMSYLVNSIPSMKYARAELGDAALFERYATLLKKHFSHYGWGTVHTAIQFMRPLLPAVDPVRAATDLTHIRSRIELVADKDPAKWAGTLKMLDAMLEGLKKKH